MLSRTSNREEMAETYTKPFESVQDAIALFEQRIDRNKNSTCSSWEERAREYLKNFGISEDETDLAVFEFDVFHKSHEELLTWLKLYKARADEYKEKFRKAQRLFFEFEKADGSRNAAAHKGPAVLDEETVRGRDFLSASEIKELFFSSRMPPIDVEDFLLQKHFENMEQLEQEVLKYVIVADYFLMELVQSKEAEANSSKSTSIALNELKIVKSEAAKLEEERNKLKEELKKLLDKTKYAISQSEKMEDLEKELLNNVIIAEYFHTELIESKGAEANSSKSNLIAMKECKLVKSEAAKLEEERNKLKEELANSLEKTNATNSQIEMLSAQIQSMRNEVSKSYERVTTLTSQLRDYSEKSTSTFADSASNAICAGIVISTEEYDALIKNSENAENLKRELEAKNAELNELVSRSEAALQRAEMAEKAKLAVEEQLRTWREQKRLRRAASDALREYAAKNPEANSQQKKPWLRGVRLGEAKVNHVPPSNPKRTVSMQDGRRYTPLAKFLNIKL